MHCLFLLAHLRLLPLHLPPFLAPLLHPPLVHLPLALWDRVQKVLPPASVRCKPSPVSPWHPPLADSSSVGALCSLAPALPALARWGPPLAAETETAGGAGRGQAPGH